MRRYFIRHLFGIPILLVVLTIAAPVAAEQQPSAWSAPNRDVADQLSLGFVVAQLWADTWTQAGKEHPWRALRCQALRLGVTIGATEGLKALVHRERPDGSDVKSMPSMHTALAAVSSGWSWSVGIPITFGAGYGRAAANKHYWSDIAVGALVGTLARKVCRS